MIFLLFSMIGFGRCFDLFLVQLLELLEVKRSPTCHQQKLRKLAEERIGSEEARVAEAIPSWWQEGGKGGGKPLLGVGSLEGTKN